MAVPIKPSRYLDEPYGRGVHVVLLYQRDDLATEAFEALESAQLRVEPFWRFWTCRIDTDEDALAAQVCVLPQYRVMVNGAERGSLVGLQDDDELHQWLLRVAT